MISKITDAELFVSDMDGTVYLGDSVIEGAIDFVEALKRKNKRLLFFTNNASRTKDYYIKKLKRLGFGECDVMTAGDVTISYLSRFHSDKTVFVLGTELLKNDMISAGIKVTESDTAEIVVSSFDTELTYQKVRTACDALHNGAVFLCTHPDYNCPLENGKQMPDSGAIVAMVSAATGKAPKFLGKPYAETAEAISVTTGVPLSKTVCIGDRLYTDIALAKNSGMTSVLVLSGETKQSDINDDNMPDIVLESVFDIIKHL